MSDLTNKENKFGTLPVFLTTISTILGAILFLRFGYAVANVGFWSVVGIVVLGHMVTVPTAFAVAEIATNQKVQGGGAYYIISRSFGMRIGAAIGIALYLSQAISIAFYVIAFSEAFNSMQIWISTNYGFPVFNKVFISLPVMSILAVLILTRGANMGMKALYVVVAILFASILMFFAGKPLIEPDQVDFFAKIPDGDSFLYVFIIIFPAFTGLAAGLGLSGDLRNPSKSIPQGTLWATALGFAVYLFVAYKLTISASVTDMAENDLIMEKIALWGPIIPIGLGAATLSSALGSIMVAPRTLQAIGLDNVFPKMSINKWLAKGKSGSNEPVNSSLVSIIIAFLFVGISGVIPNGLNFVAEIISMFFMVTYGAICAISVLEHFAADPSYRPTFRSHWAISLIGAVLSVWLMFKINWVYASLSLLLMTVIYYMVDALNKGEKRGLVKLFRGVLFQLSRQLQIVAQRAGKEDENTDWRPFVICISRDSFKRRSAFDLLRWISYKYGFGTYIHYVEGYLSRNSYEESDKLMERLVAIAKGSQNRVYINTIISPSYTSAIAQMIQLPGISGRGNNMVLFEFQRDEPKALEEVLSNYGLLQATEFDVCILNTSFKGFGYKKEIHIWITSHDYANANLMILMGYIMLGHPEWKDGQIKLFAIFKKDEIKDKKANLVKLIQSGRLPIALSNVEIIPEHNDKDPKKTICEHSNDADLTIVGYRSEMVKPKGVDLFTGFKDLGNVLFVNSNKEKEIK